MAETTLQLGIVGAYMVVALAVGVVAYRLTDMLLSDLPARIREDQAGPAIVLVGAKLGSAALLAAVPSETDALLDAHDDVVLLGHSMGGALATLVAAERDLAGLILCAPFFGLTTSHVLFVPTTWFAQFAAPALRWLSRPPNRVPIALEENRSKVLVYDWIPLRGVFTAFELRRRAASPDVLGAVTEPVLLTHSRNDTVTSHKAAEAAIEAMASTYKRALLFEDSNHVLFWDYDAEATTEAVLEFLSRVAGATTPNNGA